MNFSQDLIITSVLKISFLLSGLFLIHSGVALAKKNLIRDAGNLNANWKGFGIALRNAPLSTYLVALGTIVIVGAIFWPINITHSLKKLNLPDKSLLTELNVDSSVSTIPSKSLNVDSLNVLADYNMKKRNYLLCLKNLYLIKGVLYNREDKLGLEKKVDSNIKLAELAIKNIINDQDKSSPATEDTRSANINEVKVDTIK